MKAFYLWSLITLCCTMSLMAANGPQESWRTPAEASEYRTTPTYSQTMAYLERIAETAPEKVRFESYGTSAEGRNLVVMVVSGDGVFDPTAIHRANRPVVMIQNAIHAGEVCGKDACLALLRDILVTKEQAGLIEKAVLLILPVFNPDGHEQFSPYNRVNQNGPEEMGGRRTTKGLDLNRDCLKADAPETRGWLRLWNNWDPDFFVSNHSTNGADYQYSVTYLADWDSSPVFPEQKDWLQDVLVPYVEKSVAEAGHPIAPYIHFKDYFHPERGIGRWPATPRFAGCYALVRNRPGITVETHMLKDYRTRVTGNYEFLRALLELTNREAGELTRLNREADEAVVRAGSVYDPESEFPLLMKFTDETEPFHYRGYEMKVSRSEITGKEWIEYTDEPVESTIPRPVGTRTALSVAPPLAYIVPAQWQEVIEVLELHGLRVLRTTHPWTAEVETYRCDIPEWGEKPYQGRHYLSWPEGSGCSPVNESLTFPTGSAVVLLNQPSARTAIHLLEPMGPDSALKWGFFNTIFERWRVGPDDFILERIVKEMIEENPGLWEEFKLRLAEDPEFAKSPQRRREYFYRLSPYWDNRVGLYPVGRLVSLEGVPLLP